MSQNSLPSDKQHQPPGENQPVSPACPVCGGALVELRAKLVCTRCRTICETCCDGGWQPTGDR